MSAHDLSFVADYAAVRARLNCPPAAKAMARAKSVARAESKAPVFHIVPPPTPEPEPEPIPEPIPEPEVLPPPPKVLTVAEIVARYRLAADTTPIVGKKVTLSQIIIYVCIRRGIPRNALMSAKRNYDIIRARHEVMWIARKVTTLSRERIGHALCVDKSTVFHGIRRHQERIDAGEVSTPIMLLSSMGCFGTSYARPSFGNLVEDRA